MKNLDGELYVKKLIVVIRRINRSNLWFFIHCYYSQIMTASSRSFYCFLIYIFKLFFNDYDAMTSKTIHPITFLNYTKHPIKIFHYLAFPKMPILNRVNISLQYATRKNTEENIFWDTIVVKSVT